MRHLGPRKRGSEHTSGRPDGTLSYSMFMCSGRGGFLGYKTLGSLDERSGRTCSRPDGSLLISMSLCSTGY
jgi:hypothetical protein